MQLYCNWSFIRSISSWFRLKNRLLHDADLSMMHFNAVHNAHFNAVSNIIKANDAVVLTSGSSLEELEKKLKVDLTMMTYKRFKAIACINCI